MWGFPHGDEPEITMKVELWAGVALNGRTRGHGLLMKWALRAVKPRAEGLMYNIKLHEARTPS
jgi:hypothetical protein